MKNAPAVYTVTEVMQILHCSRNSVYKYIKEGVFPAKRIDRNHRIPAEPFLKWLNSNT